MKRICLIILVLVSSSLAFAAQSQTSKTLNIYAWTGEIPNAIVQQFEKETGIDVNISTYENNEIMYAKLRAVKNPGYDLIMPSSYFVDRMRQQNMLEKIDKARLSNWKNLNPDFLHPAYDPQSDYSLPYLWGVTGIFANSTHYSLNNLNKWSDLWNKQYYNQLMLLDDVREIFSMALLSLNYSANDTNPEHIKQAFLKLKQLMPNVKVFSSDTVVSIMIDEDATIGMSWNGDCFKAGLENPALKFIFPKDGFIIWVDTMAIPKTAEHKDAAYLFLNFILRDDIAKQIALYTQFPITNQAGQKLLPKEIRDNPTVYPTHETLMHGQFLIDVGDETRGLFEKYWEELKMSS